MPVNIYSATSPLAVGSAIFLDDFLLTGAPDGIYCDGTSAYTVSNGVVTAVSAAPSISVNIDSITPESSTGAADGSATLSASGGTAPYEYSKDGGATWQGGNSFTNLACGSYTFCVRDSGGNSSCSSSSTVPCALVASTNVSNPTSSSSNDGQVSITASGGVGPYEYSKDNGVTWQSSNTFSGLGEGSYTFKVRDSIGTTITTSSVTLAAPVPATVSLKTINGEFWSPCPSSSSGWEVDQFAYIKYYNASNVYQEQLVTFADETQTVQVYPGTTVTLAPFIKDLIQGTDTPNTQEFCDKTYQVYIKQGIPETGSDLSSANLVQAPGGGNGATSTGGEYSFTAAAGTTYNFSSGVRNITTIIEWDNFENPGPPYIDSDFVFDGNLIAGGIATGSFVTNGNATYTVEQKSGDTNGTTGKFTLTILNITDGTTVYTNTVNLVVGSYQTVNTYNLLAEYGKVYKIITKGETP